MKKLNTILIIAAVAIIIAELVVISTSNVSWSEIFSPILTIVAMILVIFQIVRNFRFGKKQKE